MVLQMWLQNKASHDSISLKTLSPCLRFSHYIFILHLILALLQHSCFPYDRAADCSEETKTGKVGQTGTSKYGPLSKQQGEAAWQGGQGCSPSSPIFLCLKDSKWPPSLSPHWSDDWNPASQDALPQVWTDVQPLSPWALGKVPALSGGHRVCGVPPALCSTRTTLGCVLSYGEVSQSFKYPSFFSTSKIIPFPQIHTGSTPRVLTSFPASPERQPHAVGAGTQASSVDHGHGPRHSQRRMLCTSLKNNKHFCASLSSLLFAVFCS